MNQISFNNVYQTSTAATNKLGERAQTPDGRQWIYIKASAALTRGKVVVPNAVTAVAATITSSADTQGRIVFVTKAAAGWTPGQFEDAWVQFDAGAPSGFAAKVKTNTNDTLELYPETALPVAADGSTTMKIWTNHNVRLALVTSKLQNAVGIVQTAFSANDYGWALTRGLGSVTADVVLTVGASFVTGGATAGQVVLGTATNGAFAEQTIGVCVAANGAVNKEALIFASLS